MAVKKATTTDDLTGIDESATPPTFEEQVAAVSEATAPEMVAKVDEPKYTKVKSPSGAVSTVPEGILDALLESGYTKSK